MRGGRERDDGGDGGGGEEEGEEKVGRANWTQRARLTQAETPTVDRRETEEINRKAIDKVKVNKSRAWINGNSF